MEPYEFEALEWLQRNTAKNALGHNQFRGTQEAIEAVKRLYAAGAIEVRVGPVLDDPESLAKFGGPYSSVLKIVFRPNKR